MKLLEFVSYLERLESERSRLLVNDILSDLFGRVGGIEGKAMVEFMMGNLGPAYEAMEMGMAERMVTKSISKVLNVSEGVVWLKFKNKGDMGLVIKDLGERESNELEFMDVFGKLKIIAAILGDGSQERKIDSLAELISKMSSNEAKFAIRFVVHQLRLGIAEMSVIDGLSVLVCGDKSLHDKLEAVYNVSADIGELVKLVLENKNKDRSIWIANLEGKMNQIKVKLGVPVVSALCTRMDTFDEIITKLKKVYCEPKYDGTRVQIHFQRNGNEWKVRTFTRNMEESSNMFPELEKIGDYLNVDEVILDSEALGWNDESGKFMDFQMTITRKRKHGIDEHANKVPLKFMVFDVLYARGKAGENWGDIHDWPIEERKVLLSKIVTNSKLIEITPSDLADNGEKIKIDHKRYLSLGLEGVVVKQVGSPYIPGRKKGYWVKIKEDENAEGQLSDTIDCVVMGYYRGEGRRADLKLGSILLGVKGKPDLVGNGLFESEEGFLTLCKLGTKMTDEQIIDLVNRLDLISTKHQPEEYYVSKNLVPDVWVKPLVVLEIAGDAITESPNHTAGVSVRFPRLIRERVDKSVDQVTTLEEVMVIGKRSI